TTLPDSIGQLVNLKRLILVGNRIARLPETLMELPTLEQFFVHGNDALGLPPEVLGPTLEQVTTKHAKPSQPLDIIEYYLRLKSGSRPLNEAKLIFVGRGAVGKTSLVNRLVSNTFSEGEKKTDGINITTWNVRLNQTERVRLNIWDFGGQEIMHATHQFFLTQ